MSATETRRLDDLPALPRDEAGPVFAAPWEAQVFAMTLRLHEAGLFSWSEWVAVFSAELAAGQAADAAGAALPEDGSDYYLRWLAALERLVAQKGLLSTAELGRRKAAWARAAATTPHGEPIVLPDDA